MKILVLYPYPVEPDVARPTNYRPIQLLSRTPEACWWVLAAKRPETLASGTGACAATVAGVLNNRLDRKVKAEFDYGELQVEWSEENDHLIMIGPAVETFSGVFNYIKNAG